MTQDELRERQLDFEKIKDEFKDEFGRLEKLREQFVREYPKNVIAKLRLDEYVYNKERNTFCYRLQEELKGLGSNKSRNYTNNYGIHLDSKGNYRISKQAWGKDVEEALKNICLSIIELIENKDDLELLKKNKISPMFKGKILSIYHPNKFLNIFAESHLNYFINRLGLPNTSNSVIDKRNLLLGFKNQDEVMKNWSIYEYYKFLYTAFGKPGKKKLLAVLEKYDEFSNLKPIESLKIDPIEDLQTSKINEASDPKNKTDNRERSFKVDYERQSRRNKAIGNRGEQIVLTYEKRFLEKKKRKDLADQIEHTASKGDGAGYDIKSFDSDGKPRFIEVKSTTAKLGENHFYITANELKRAKAQENYYFYFVYDVLSENPKIWKVKSTDLLADENIVFEPTNYRFKVKADTFV